MGLGFENLEKPHPQGEFYDHGNRAERKLANYWVCKENAWRRPEILSYSKGSCNGSTMGIFRN